MLLLLFLFPILPAFALTTYTVKSGDSLWRIASKHGILGTPNKDMIQAIKGINSKENPSINDDIININQKLLIPTTKQEVEDGVKLYTLRHTLYLNQNNPASTLEQALSLTETSFTLANKKQQSTISIKQSDSTLYSLPENSIVNTNNNQINTSQHSNSTIEGIVITPAITNTNVDHNKDSRLNTENTNINIHTKAKTDYNQWLIIILIVIVIFLIWQRRLKRKATFAQHDTRVMKDQFYAKTSDPTKDKEGAVINKQSETERISKKASKDEIKKLLQKANELLEAQDIAHAKTILQEALNSEPKNLDIRIKILAIYGADGDEISFNSERDYLASNLLPYDDKRWKDIDTLYKKYFGIN